ncbi:MAG TPA: hypothetical protein VKA60_17865 [Blastocatellia bacterium]|nr:hypothetical protein [Blastocatellia bacterium]
MSDQQDRNDRSQGEDQEAGRSQSQSDGSDVVGGGSGRSSGSSDVVDSSSDLGPNTGTAPRQPEDGGEVY